MAKMSKSQTEQLACDMANKDVAMTSLTLAEITGMDRTTSGDYSFDLATRAMATTSLTLEDRWAAEFKVAYANRARQIWNAKVTQHERARQSWQSAASAMSLDAAAAKVRQLLEDMHIRGARVLDGSGSVTLEADRAWSIKATLYVYIRVDHSDSRTVTNPDDERQRAYPASVTVKLSWSSTTRDVADALACVTLYRELTEAAAEVEAVMAHERVYYVHGLEQ